MQAIAIKAANNYGGIEILAVRDGIDEGVTVRDNYGGQPSRARRSAIRYSAAGDAYFMHNGRREYLRDFLRVG